MEEKKRYLTLIFTFLVVILDQYTKYLITANIYLGSIGWSFFGDFIRIIHVRNTGIAFSLGSNISQISRLFSFILLPSFILMIILYYIFKSNINDIQRWSLAGILGGGIGNVLIDRIFRKDGVVDFIDIKFFIIKIKDFYMERWPTFNIADATVFTCGIILFINMIIEDIVKSKTSN